jgi:hypothetical protein
MFKKTEKPAACEMSVIRFFNARNIKLADIHRQLCEVYGEHAMSDSMVRRWMRHFNEGRKNVHDDPRSGQPSVVNEDLIRAVKEKIQENIQYKWFGNKVFFFLNSPSELTFWITYIFYSLLYSAFWCHYLLY